MSIKLMKDVLKYTLREQGLLQRRMFRTRITSVISERMEDEADLVYQFPLPPLTMYTFLSENAKILSNWMETLELPNDKVTYFQFS